MADINRYWMKISLSGAESPGHHFPTEEISLEHLDSLTDLMSRAFQPSPEHPNKDINAYREDIKGMLDGKDGAFIKEASFVCMDSQGATAACFVTYWKDLPLLAEIMTAPAYQKQGRGEFLLRKAMHALKNAGYDELYLCVTEGNSPAETLYQKIGFEFLGPYIPERVYKRAEELLCEGDNAAKKRAIELLEEQVKVRPNDPEARKQLRKAQNLLGK